MAASGGVFGHIGPSIPWFVALGFVASRGNGGFLDHADHKTISAIARRRTPIAVSAAQAASALGEPRFAVATLAAGTIAARRANRRLSVSLGLGVVTGMAMRRLLAEAIARPRPPAAMWLAEPEGYSLPSRHTSLAALTAGAVLIRAGSPGVARYGVPLLAAGVVGASRVYLGVHWPSDVLAAWLFAEGWLHLAEAVVPVAAGRGTGSPSGTASPAHQTGHQI
jgi:membrane-associated phospholipid phosphatase